MKKKHLPPSLYYKLSQKYFHLQDEEKATQEKRTNAGGPPSTTDGNHTAVDQMKMQKENEHFFVSVDKFNKLLESLSDTNANGKTKVSQTLMQMVRV